ncbi:hypothetical protein ACWNYH_00435 [Candidatus Vidania fulgoroideorum]
MCKKNFSCISDLRKLDLLIILKYSFFFEKRSRSNFLKNKRILLFFDSQSTRTRLSTELAINELGGKPILFFSSDSQLKKGERYKENCNVVSRFFDITAIRTGNMNLYSEFEKSNKGILINLLNPIEHPCQVISDIYTILKFKRTFKKVKIVWYGRKNNMWNSWNSASKLLKLSLTIIDSKESKFKRKELKYIFNNSDVLMTDSWNIIGEKNNDKFYGITLSNNDIMENKNIIFMHCLPAFIGLEVSEDILYSKSSVVFEQSFNKIASMKAIIYFLIKKIGCA